MVSIKSIVTLAMAVSAYAAPTAQPEAGTAETGVQALSKRGDALGDVWVCYDYDWQGKCANFIIPYRGCINFQDWYPLRKEDIPAGSDRRTPRSIGPSQNTWCLVYRDTWCKDQFGGAFSKPGIGRIEGMKSIQCWW